MQAPHLMQLSASAYQGSSAILRLPLSRIITCISLPSELPANGTCWVIAETYTVIFCPDALMAWPETRLATSFQEGTIFSLPMTTMCILGELETNLPFPSFVSITTVPVSATPMFPPVTPISADRKLGLRYPLT